MKMAQVKPSDAEIDRVLNWVAEADEDGSHYPGATYEEGVRATIEWMMGRIQSAPDED